MRGIRGYFLRAPEAFKGSTVNPDDDDDCSCCCDLRSAMVVEPFVCPLEVAIEGILFDRRGEEVKKKGERGESRFRVPCSPSGFRE